MRNRNEETEIQFISKIDAFSKAKACNEEIKKLNICIKLSVLLMVIAGIIIVLTTKTVGEAGFGVIIAMNYIFVPMLIVYIVTHTLGEVFRKAKRVAFWGWLFVPFPFDIVTGIFSFMYAAVGFILCPVFMLMGVRRKYRNIMEMAENYIACSLEDGTMNDVDNTELIASLENEYNYYRIFSFSHWKNDAEPEVTK